MPTLNTTGRHPEVPIVARLKDTSTTPGNSINSVAGDRIFPLNRPQETALPAIVYDLVSTSPATVLYGGTTAASSSFEVDCIAENYLESKDLAELVVEQLENWSNGESDPKIQRVQWENENDIYEPPQDGEGKGLYRCLLRFTIHWTITWLS